MTAYCLCDVERGDPLMSTTNTTDAPAGGPSAGSARVAPSVHALPVEHAERGGAPVDPSTLPVRPGEDPTSDVAGRICVTGRNA